MLHAARMLDNRGGHHPIKNEPLDIYDGSISSTLVGIVQRVALRASVTVGKQKYFSGQEFQHFIWATMSAFMMVSKY